MRARRWVLPMAVVILAFVIPGRAGAQTPAEDDLRARLARQPADIATLLDLAKLYVAEQRFDEAMATTQRAAALIRQRQGTPSTRPPAPAAGAVFTPVQGGVFGQTVAPEPAPQGAVRVGGDVRMPTKVRDVRPEYPANAQAARVQGIVIIEATIGTTGKVTDAKVLRSIPLLDQAALDAVRQWEFTPTLLNGQPTAIIMSVTVNFTLN